MKSGSSLRALGSRNYRLYLGGQGLSLVGSWMQQLAMSWLVYRLTGSAALMGASTFAAQIPMLFLSPIAGVLADRLDKRRVVIVTQFLLLLQAGTLAYLVYTGMIRMWHVFVLNVFFGIVNSFDMPTRQSMVVDLVDRKEDLPNAIALMSAVVNVTRLIGPAVAGFLIGVAGEATCFLANAVSFLAVLVSLFFIRLTPKPAVVSQRAAGGFREGLKYAFGFPPIGALLGLLAAVSFLGMPYTVLMPIFAREIMGHGATTMGFLATCSGLGALTGSIYLARRNTVRGLLRRIAACAACFGVGLVWFSCIHSVIAAAPALFLAGFGVMVMMAACNTVLQTLAPDDKRGRVMSLYVASMMGVAPLGGLLAGFAAQHIGAPATTRIGGIFCVVAAALFGMKIPALRTLIRPVYIAKGLLPRTGIDAAEIVPR